MNAQVAVDRQPSNVATLRVPPQDVDAERAVLGGLMLVPEALAKIADWLNEGDFYLREHRAMFRAITHLLTHKSPVDAVTIGDWITSNGLTDAIDPTYPAQLANDTPSAANIVAYAEIVAEKSRLRAAIGAGESLADAAWRRGADSGQVIAESIYRLSQMQSSKLRGGLEPVRGAMQRMQTTLMERYQQGPGLIGMPWPWSALNDATKGLRDGVLYVVGGRPSMGKSVFGLQAALYTALAGNRTAFFSVEMSAEECMSRAVACVGEIPHDWVESPARQDDDAEVYWSRLANATQRIIEAPMVMDETPGLTVDQLMARARRAHMQKPLRLIVVDHMHDMTLDPKRETRLEYGRIAQAGKTLAKEFHCPVILLAQLSRALVNRTDKRPTLNDLRESGEIEQKADVVLLLHREDYYDKNTHMGGVVEVIPAKGRNIRVGNAILLKNCFGAMRMDDWTDAWPEAPERPHRGSRGMR